MPMRDTATRLIADLAGGIGLLTRLPLPQSAHHPHRPGAAWAWPLVGLVLGAMAAAIGWLALALGLPAGSAAVAVLATTALATGALHEDGLADSFDGLFGGWTRERRLEIMKDSHIGSYGTLALLLVVLAKWQALTVLLGRGDFGALIAACMVSRAMMVWIMALLPNARGTGLSAQVGRPGRGAAAIATLIAAAGLCLAAAPLPMALGAVLAASLMAWLARARIGGQTGDILGGSQQLAELAALTAALSVM